MWHRELTVAIVEKNTEKIEKLILEMPQFETLQEKEDAMALIQESLKLLRHLKEETEKTLRKLEKHRGFLVANSEVIQKKFDVIS